MYKKVIKIAFYAIDNIKNETVKKLFQKSNCVELFFTSELLKAQKISYDNKIQKYNQQLQFFEKNGGTKPKEPKGKKTLDQLKSRIDYIEKDFAAIQLSIDNNLITNKKIIKHIFNYFFPMSIKGAVSGTRFIHKKFYPTYEFDKQSAKNLPISEHKAKIIICITELLCSVYKTIFPEKNYQQITTDFFSIRNKIKVDYNNGEIDEKVEEYLNNISIEQQIPLIVSANPNLNDHDDMQI